MGKNNGFNIICTCVQHFCTKNERSLGGKCFEMSFLRMMLKEPSFNPLKKRAGIVVTWWIGAGYHALRTLSVAFLVGFESDGQGFGFWCEFFGTLGPTVPGKWEIVLTWKTVPNLLFPMLRKSPFLPLQSSRGWATSNVGQDTTREGQELIFCNIL